MELLQNGEDQVDGISKIVAGTKTTDLTRKLIAGISKEMEGIKPMDGINRRMDGISKLTCGIRRATIGRHK